MLNKDKASWDKLEQMEHDLWLEENPGGTLKQFQMHLDSLNAGIEIDGTDTEYSVEEMERMYLLHVARQ